MTAADSTGEAAEADKMQSGTWKVLDSKTVFITLGEREYTMEFEDSRAEAVLTKPYRYNPSKMRLGSFHKGRFNIKYNRFMQTEKCFNDYYVFAGQGDKGDHQLWELVPVENTKYFNICCKGIHGGEAYLSLHHDSFKNLYHDGRYLLAGPEAQQRTAGKLKKEEDDKSMLKNFIIYPYEEDFSEVRFISADGLYMPYITNAENPGDISCRWKPDLYVLAASRDYSDR